MSNAPDDDARGEIYGAADARRVLLVVAAIADHDGLLLAKLLADEHPADSADIIEGLSADQLRIALAVAPDAFSGAILSELAWEMRERVLAALSDAQIAKAVSDLDSDDAALLIEDLEPDRRESVLAAVSARERRAVEDAMSFEEETVGRRMQREVVAAPDHWTVGDTIDNLRAAADDDLPDGFYEVYVVDPAFRPVGAVALSTLLRKPRDAKLQDIMAEPTIRVSPEMDQEDIAYAFAKYHLVQAPVVDAAGRLRGMITVDDVVDVIQEEHKEDLLGLAGVSEAGVGDGVFRKVQARAPWLGFNLLTALAASSVIGLFEATIAQIVALAILMPIVASMGGNTGTQALAVAVRALAARHLNPGNARRMILREMGAGFVNGGLFAVLIGAASFAWFQDVRLSAVIGAAMWINLTVAGLAGIAIPLILQRLRQDPAVSSSVFLTTVTDVVGFFVFLGLATLVLL